MSEEPDPPRPAPEDPGVAELDGRLRGRWKAERRAHEEEIRREHWQSRTLVDAVAEAMRRGDEVAVHLPGRRTLTSHVMATGRDYAIIEECNPPRREYGVRLIGDPAGPPLHFLELKGGGKERRDDSPREAPPTFQALLQQYDFQQHVDPDRHVELDTTFEPHRVRGTLLALAPDHLYIRDHAAARELLIPTTAVACITWADPHT